MRWSSPWNLHFVLICLGFLVVFGIIRMIMKKKGSWSESISPEVSHIPYITESSEINDSAGEKKVRAFLESYFQGHKFPKARPFFLNNGVTGNNLELDCYNKDLHLAVEYNGRQHYDYIPYFHQNKEAFYNQKYRDELKKIYCRDFGITLITVPYTERDIPSFLRRALSERQENELASK